MKPHDFASLVCVAAVIVFPVQVMADAPAAPVDATGSLFGKPVAMATLDKYRGGSDLVQNDMKLIGTTTGNSATDVSSGSNAISAGAFANMSGLPLVIQNSGANVLIQNAVILHLQMN
ncbi:MAG TPA: hypothetical protein VFM48_06580 [Aquabacterium sp.]|nr:hypothetical protein [Aquabacterium sp.]